MDSSKVKTEKNELNDLQAEKNVLLSYLKEKLNIKSIFLS